MNKEKRFKRLALLRKLKLIKQSREINILDKELVEIKDIDKELSDISKEVNSSIKSNSMEAWKLKSTSVFSAKVSEQLSIITNRKKFIYEEILRAKNILGRTHSQKRELDKKIKVISKINNQEREQKALNLLPPIRNKL